MNSPNHLNDKKAGPVTGFRKALGLCVVGATMLLGLNAQAQISIGGNYTYNASGVNSVRPHAVTGVVGQVNGVTNPSYAYDANGNVTSAGNKTIDWTGYNMPSQISKSATAGSAGQGTAQFLYGPEHQRVLQRWYDTATASGTSPAGSPTHTTVYLGALPVEKVTHAVGTTAATGLGTGVGSAPSTAVITEYQQRITLDGSPNGRVVAIYTDKSDGISVVTDIQYVHPDNLGSTALISNSAGTASERYSYDPWGDRRTLAGLQDPSNALQPGTIDAAQSTNRGFTGHEHLDRGNLGLINANARIYDPTLGMFLSPDPYVQAPFYTQSLNRYTYTFNNPLHYVDPSGFVAIRATRMMFDAIGTGNLTTFPGSSGMGGFFLEGLGGKGDSLLDGILGRGYTCSIPMCLPSVDGGANAPSAPQEDNYRDPYAGPDKGELIFSPTGPRIFENTSSETGEFERVSITAHSRPLGGKAGGMAWSLAPTGILNCHLSGGCGAWGWGAAAGGDGARLIFAGATVGAKAIISAVRAKSAAKGVPAALETTVHGAERIAGAAATRGGVLSVDGVAAVRESGRVLSQADGATVRVLETSAGRFNVVVEGERGIITTFENLKQKSLDRLAKNYGWE